MEARFLNSIRTLLGIMLVFWGINLLIELVPIPPMNDSASAFYSAMRETGYMIPAVSLVLISTGICFVANRLVTVALLMLTPVSANIFIFLSFIGPLRFGRSDNPSDNARMAIPFLSWVFSGACGWEAKKIQQKR